MAHRSRSLSFGGDPMEIDLRGLQLSRWDPQSGDLGQKAIPKFTRGDSVANACGFADDYEEKALKQIASLVSDGELVKKVWAIIQSLVTAKERQARGAGAADTLQPLITKTVTKAIKQTIHEELKELKEANSRGFSTAPQATPTSWAQRAATGLPTKGGPTSFNLKPVPARLSR